MVNWKIALVVIVIAILVVAIGMWFGYQYASEQDDISTEGWHKPSNTVDSLGDTPLFLTPSLVRISQRQYYFS